MSKHSKFLTGYAISLLFLLPVFSHASSLEEQLQKLREAGIPTTIEELNLPDIPDEENGALVYREVFQLIDKLYKQHKEVWEYFPAEGMLKWEDVPLEKKEKVADLILHNTEFIKMYQLMDKASNMKSRYLTKKNLQKYLTEFPNGDLSFSLLVGLRRCARMLSAKATIESEYGSIENAFNASLTGLRLSKSISDEPLLVSQLVRMALNAIAVSSLKIAIQKGESDSELYKKIVSEMCLKRNAHSINQWMPVELIINDLPRFSYWRKLGEEMFEFNEDDRKTIERITEQFKSMSGDYNQRIEATEKRLREKRAALKEAYLKSGCEIPVAFVDMQEVFYLDKILRIFNLSKKPFWEMRDELQKIDDEIRKAPKEKAILSREILQSEHSNMFTGWFIQETREHALLGTAQIGLANRIYKQKHGEFANSLNQLTPEILPALSPDPFTGKDYIYRKTDTGFIVYSVGENLTDDGGIDRYSREGRKKGSTDIVCEIN
jgi:hypothetical protein